ncbi:MAG: CBS domain-containing protein [Candidatus Aenigmarchaeota archaeon]|nr:CBS domain-containing protein [Candidatus Aenigmarchaeota archaeon]
MLGFLRKKQKEAGCGLFLRNFAEPQDSILKIASKEVVACSEDDRIIDVLASMLSGVRRVPVVGEQGEVKGIVSATDVLSFIGAGDKSKFFTNTGLSATVKKIMEGDVNCLTETDSIPVVLEFFKMNGKPIHPVTSQKKLHSVVSETDIVNLVSKPTGVSVSRIMSAKPIVIQEDYPVRDVAKMLCRGPYRRLPVVNNGVVMGIVTPYDILSHLNRNETLNTLAFESAPIKSIMNKDVAYVSPDADVYDAVRTMKIKKVSGLPVVDEDADLVGMISKRDIIEAMC